MLKKFSVENFKGFKDKIVWELDSKKNYNFNQKLISNNCVSKGLIYGINGSGKTNLGYALFDITRNLTDNQVLPMAPNTFLNLETKKTYAEFEYTFIFDSTEVIYKYRKKALTKLTEEHLYIAGKEVIYYDYETNTGATLLKGAETLNSMIQNESAISRVKYVANNSILEDNAENAAFRKFMDYVNRMLFFFSRDQRGYQGFMVGAQNIGEGILERGEIGDFEQFLKEFDINYELEEAEVDGNRRIYCRFPKGDIELQNIASTGTSSLSLFYYWYIRMQEASFVYIDEFDAFYDFSVATAIVKKVCEFTDVQIFMSTHNTDLLSNDILRPDCYYILRNNKITALSNLTNKELRQAHNLQKMYKAGAFNEDEN